MMRTHSRVHSPQERLRQRTTGARLCQLTMARLMACTAMLRVIVTTLLPIAGSAMWWVTLLCMLPALVVAALLEWAMRKTNTVVLTDCVGKLLGRPAVRVVSVVTALLLLAEGVASFTALTELLAESATPGMPQVVPALGTGVMLLFCLDREGLPRGVFFLRGGLLAVLILLLPDTLSMARMDHLFPMLGSGATGIRGAVLDGFSLGWTLLLPLFFPSASDERQSLRTLSLPILPCGLAALGLCLTLPHELLTSQRDLSGLLLMPAAFLRPLNRTLLLCLWMVCLSLTVAGCGRLSADRMLQGKQIRWLSGVLVLLMALSQSVTSKLLLQWLQWLEPWLLAPFALLTVLLVLASLMKGRRHT